MRASIVVAWYDMWIGLFVDMPKRRAFLFPVPCVGLLLEWGERP